MYTVVIQHQNGSLITETEIHNDYYLAPQKKLQSATLELEENTAGTFNFTVPKGQYGNGNGTDIDIKNDEAIVYQNVEVDPDKQTSRGKEIWRGFFLENDTEFFNSKAFTCIGELAYLNETIQKDATYKFEGDNDYPEKVFKALLGVHNAKVPAKKQFQPGTITVKADNTASHLVNRVQTDEFTTAYSDHTFDCIKKLIESCGGYLKVRREDGVRYLDWLNTYEANGQTINFGKNLLDYAVNQDVTDLITVLYPFGESQSETVDDGQGGTTTKRAKVNISTASGQNGRMYVTLNDTGSYSPDPMAELGWREGTVDFPNVRDPNNLKRLAINYLKNQWDPELKLYTKIQIKAVDLAYFRDEDAAPIEFLQSVKVTSIPHGITNKVVPVTKMTIPLLQPEQTIYTMSTAMRKTKQISTSVTDHDKDIEKTQETIDDTGGGEEEEGEGEVVIEGKDPTDDWVIGKPTVGKEPSKKGDSEYLKHQKHLKVWYDMDGKVDRNGYSFVSNWDWLPAGSPYVNLSASPLATEDHCLVYMHESLEDGSKAPLMPFEQHQTVMEGRVVTYPDGWYDASHYNLSSGEAGWYPKYTGAEYYDYVDGHRPGDDISQHVYLDGEFAGGPGGLWRPGFVSDDLKEGSSYIDDKESHTFKDGTNNRTIAHGYADIHGNMPINIYFKEAWATFGKGVRQNDTWRALNVMQQPTLWFDRCVELDEPQSMEWGCLHATTEGRSQDPYHPDPDIDEENHLLVGTPLATSVSRLAAADWDAMVSKVKGWQKIYSRYSAGKVFCPKVSGVMPMLQRPLQSDAQSIVIYAVADFCYGVNSSKQWLSGISTKTVGFGGYNIGPWATAVTPPPEFDRRLCRFGTTGSDPERTLPIGLYRLDLITDGPEGYTGTPMALMPCGKWWAYAWVLNIGAGEKYPVTSDLTGGLFVCNSSGLIWTGHAKWTSDYNAAQEDPRVNYKRFAHFPQFNKTENAKDQCIFINGIPGTLTTSKKPVSSAAPEGEEYPRNYDGQGERAYNGLIGHYINQTGSDALEHNAMGLKAIGYCRAAYQQITVDEVVDNLNFLFDKYCKA